MFDLEAYLNRIGLDGRPSIAQLHRAHVASIPFENLDPQRGVPVSLELSDLQSKLVYERRGGYCFEHNLLLKSALEALGAEVEPMLARVRFGVEPGVKRPRGHLVLCVRTEGAVWHADAGFGRGTLLEPIPFRPGEVHELSGWPFRVVQDGQELVLQTDEGEGWFDLYGFVPEPVPQADIEVNNWFTSTHPRSMFVTGLLVASQSGDGVRRSLSDWGELRFTEQTPAETRVTPVEREAVPELLATRFGLEGFTLGVDHHLVLASDALI